MMFRKNTLILAGMIYSLSAHAAPSSVKEFTVGEDKQKIKTLVPEGWDAIPNLYNTPLALLSQKGLQGTASVIQIVPFGIKDSDENLNKMKKDPESYYSQKDDQIESADGEMISYEPFEEVKKDGATISSIGVKYKNDSGEYLDQTYYVTTKSKELFYIKALIPLDQQNEHNDMVSQVVNSISSKN